MAFTGIFVATLCICLLLALATLSTSILYAITQILSRCAEILFDLHLPSRQ